MGMGLRYNQFFDDAKYDGDGERVITCKQCLTHLCHLKLVILDGFLGQTGKAFLVLDLINYEFYLHLHESHMRTGVYQIHKVRCHTCELPLGWYYKKAYIPEEEYKEGNFVIENAYINFLKDPSSTKELVDRAMVNRTSRKVLFNLGHQRPRLASASSSDALPRCPYWRRDLATLGHGYHGVNSYANMVRRGMLKKGDASMLDDEVLVDG